MGAQLEIVEYSEGISDYADMMRYIYESFFKGADANVK